jgi:hypothetical protein
VLERSGIVRIPPPIVDQSGLPQLVIPKPVVDVPRPTIEYPIIFLPPSAPTPAAPQAPATPQKPAEAAKDTAPPARSLPTPPSPSPVVPPPVAPPAPPSPLTPAVPAEPPAIGQVVSVAGQEIQLPAPQEIAQASATAVVGTSVTLATAMVFNQARRIVGETVTKAARSKFKIKLRVVKPVIHMIQEENGVTVLEYSAEGIRTLATKVQSPEQYLRDTIEADELYEIDHKIVIDEPIRETFTKEGAKRFNYFAPPKKLAKRLAARIALG